MILYLKYFQFNSKMKHNQVLLNLIFLLGAFLGVENDKDTEVRYEH